MIAFITGLFIGGAVTFVVMCLVTVGGRADGH